MKRRPVSLLLFVTIITLLTAVHPMSAKAQTADFLSFPSGINVYSPLNMTYDSRYLFLNLTLYSAGQMGYIDPYIHLNYSVDGDFNSSVPLVVSNPGLHVVTNAATFMSLPKLSEGSHILTLYLFGHNQKSLDPKYLSYVDTVYFSVGAGASELPPPGWVAPEVAPQDLTPPRISVLSPARNESFETSNITSLEISLNFTVDEEAYSLSFSVDEQPNSTIAGNYSFRGLPAGLHNVTVYAWDSAGNIGASETVSFTITVFQEPEQESDSSLVLPLAASGLTVAAVGTAVVIYLKKRKRV